MNRSHILTVLAIKNRRGWAENYSGDWTRLELFIAGMRLMQTLEPLTCQEIISFSARRSHVD